MEWSSSSKALGLTSIKLLRLCLLPVGGWTHTMKEQNSLVLFNIHTIFVTIQLLTVTGEICYLYQNFGVVDFYLIGDVYITTFLTMLSVVRLSSPTFKSYRSICKQFLTEFHLVHFKHEAQFRKVFSVVDQISHYYTTLTVGMLWSGVLLFNLSPLYVNYSNGAFTTNRHNMNNITLQFAVNYKYPGYDQRQHFYSTTLINLFLSIVCSLSILAFDLLLMLMTFQIIGHLEILGRNMRSIAKPRAYTTQEYIDKRNIINGVEMFNASEDFEIKQTLKGIVDHHRLIISFTDGMSTSFGPILCFTYLFHLVSCCLLLLECSRGDPDVIVRYGPLTLIVFLELIQVSVILEVVGSKSEALIDCVYDLPWQYMSIESQRIVFTMLCRVQRPIRITACGIVDVGIQTMANILKTTFSYYTFLRSL